MEKHARSTCLRCRFRLPFSCTLASPRRRRRCSRDAQLPLLLALGLKGPLSEDRARALLAYLEAERPWAAPAARVLGPAPAPSSS